MKFYAADGTEASIQQLDPGSLCIMRVTRSMSKDEFFMFCKDNKHIVELFEVRRITLLICPDWVEFKEWK